MTYRGRKIQRLLVANRGEIAIRVMRAATELGITTVAIFSDEDRFALHRTKADESYQVGKGMGPVEAYLSIDEIVRVCREAHVDAVHPGYGFLSENPAFAEACAAAGVTFVGPTPDVMRRLGNKVAARNLAIEAGVPVMPATDPLPRDDADIKRLGDEIGYPVMLKASWGGGGRGMRVIRGGDEVLEQVNAARREAQAGFGNDEVYFEKLVERARHVEVQILGDFHGNVVHLYERDCSVQRRHQKVVERAPAIYLDDAQRQAFCDAALKLARKVGYQAAGTVEFLQDADTGDFYFIEVNPRIQVEHTVTECVTGVDLIKAQIRVAEGARLGDPGTDLPLQDDIHLYGHAMQCRVTSEDPENNFIPDYGRITAYRSAAGFGIRLDAGTAYSGARITRFYDSLLVKVTAWGRTAEETRMRMDRALREFRVRGVSTNLRFVETLINHPSFKDASYTTRFIDETPALFRFPRRRDRATRLLNFIGDVLVNGNPEVADRPRPAQLRMAEPPTCDLGDDPPPGSRQRLEELGPEGFASWMLDQEQVLVTDTTFRDAHQSLLATRFRTADMVDIAPAYARLLPELLSVESWGGATFDVAMRFLKECPWERLERLREGMPNLLQQMLLRASNGVGYTNYPDNVVRYFVERAADGGVDVFRIFDSLNWVENMRVAIDAVRESGKLCEAAICYTGDLTDPDRPKYDLAYYVDMARQLEAAGAHILGIKDMAGLCNPTAAATLVRALKQEIGLPIHFHTHDTSGISAASVLAAVEAGADAVDAAMDSMSGLTSQPNLGSIVQALRHGPRDPGLDPEAIRRLSTYWEAVRGNYAAFESDMRSGVSEVYQHEIPGGQYTNLRQQARALGLEKRWPEVSLAYAQVNQLFGDIVKVTPSSKVVGDMALMMVSSGLTPDDVVDPDKDIAFPESVVGLFRGELGQPPGGFPQALQAKVLKGEAPITIRPGAGMPAADLDALRKEAEHKAERHISDNEFASYLMYPDVFTGYCEHRRHYGDVSILPTPAFFYGLESGEEITVPLERGKDIIIRFLTVGETDEDGEVRVFFELNGQPRSIKVVDRKAAPTRKAHPKADANNAGHVGAPMPGLIVRVAVNEGQRVQRGDALLDIEAMKMQTTVAADRDGTVARVVAEAGMQVDAKDLLVVLDDAA